MIITLKNVVLVMNYKKFLLLFIVIIIAFYLFGCDEKFTFSIVNCKIKSGKEITLFIASDPHHLSEKTYDHGKAFDWFLNSGDGKLLHYIDEILDAFTMEIEERRPDILIIPGDLTCNGEKESHLELAEKLSNLNNFHKYSKEFFRKRTYDKYYDSLLEISKFSDEKMKAISKTISELSLKYFAGYRNNLIHEALDTEGFAILQKSAPFTIKNYVMSMFDDQKTDNNRIYIPIKKD